MEQQSNKKPKLAALKGPNIEAFQRINYLYQAAQEALPVNRELSRFYIHTMKAIAARLVLRLYSHLSQRYAHVFLTFSSFVSQRS